MHKIYVYTYAWTCSCNCNGEDFGAVDRWKIEGNHLLGKEEHSEGDNYSGITGRSCLWEVKEEILRSSAERRWRMLFERHPTARRYHPTAGRCCPTARCQCSTAKHWRRRQTICIWNGTHSSAKCFHAETELCAAYSSELFIQHHGEVGKPCRCCRRNQSSDAVPLRFLGSENWSPTSPQRALLSQCKSLVYHLFFLPLPRCPWLLRQLCH